MPFLHHNGASLYYELHGPKPGTAPAIVFAHGLGGNHLSWWQQVPHFRDRYTCLVFDHRGFGLSTEHPGGPQGAAFASDLLALLDHAGINTAILVAQSMGGWTCLRFALDHPERVRMLVMSDTHGGLSTPEIDEELRKAWAALRDVPAGVHPAAGVRMHREQPGLHFLYAQINDLNPARTPQEGSALMASAGRVTPDQAAGLRVPVRFIVGEEDIVIPPRVIELAARRLGGAPVVRIENAGHSVYFERAARYNEVLQRFFTEL